MNSGIVITDRVYARAGGQDLKVRIYSPAGEGPFPAMIDLHGGAWTHFDHTVDFYWCRELAKRGFVMVSVEFRLAPENPWPDFLEDVRAAARWTRHHAAELSVDPQAIGVIGGSTGGHLAAMLGLVPNRHDGRPTAAVDTPDDAEAHVDWVIAHWPILDVPGRYRMAKFARFGAVTEALAGRLHERRRRSGGGNVQGGIFDIIERIDRIRNHSRARGDLLGSLVQRFLYLQGTSALGRALIYPMLVEAHEGAFRDETEMEAASPFHIVEQGRMEKLPPMLVVQGRRDSNMTTEMTGRFAALYRRRGGEIVTKYPSRLGHSFGNVPGPDADRLIGLVEQFASRLIVRRREKRAA